MSPVTYALAPAWARHAAHLVVLLALPSGLWRLALALGFRAGHTEQGYLDRVGSTSGALYVVALSVLAEGIAMLTLGLVRPWGEVVPRWIPFVGGRPIPPPAVVVPASIGTVILFAIWTPFVFWWNIPDQTLTPIGHTLVGVLYLPLIAWAPLLGAVTLDYHRRHRPAQPEGEALSERRPLLNPK
ncbi:MAG TPA: hypothetical protein VFF55_06205 [Candidatus Deferrimicrobium sp.]|nr:hypothetical protein [Candidatus Deferrimicrobium sp.]